MMLLRPAFLFGLTAVLALTTAAPETAHSANPAAALRKAKKKSSAHKHHGVVESVGQKGNVGSMTIKEHHHKSKKGAKGGAGKDKTFTITNSTVVTKHGKATKLAELHKGEHVAVTASHSLALKVEVVAHKHKKKAKKKKI